MKLAGKKEYIFLTALCMIFSCIGFSFAMYINYTVPYTYVSGINKNTSQQLDVAQSNLSIWDKLAQDWIWIVVGCVALVFTATLLASINAKRRKTK